MKLTVLVDNNTSTGKCYFGEPGLSFYIEIDNKKILFDTGYSDIFIQNAFKMNINLRNLDYLVFSHGHYDHTWGLVPLIRLYKEAIKENIPNKKPLVVTHPFTFLSKSRNEMGEIGSLISEEKLSRNFELKLSKKPLWITEKLVYLGEIPRNNNFENQASVGQVYLNENWIDDYIIEDSALVYKSKQGLVIVTGCSHSGICNIVEYAKQVCEDERIFDIIGGLHLVNPSDEQLSKTVEYIKALNLHQLHACHCTDLHSKIALSQVTRLGEVSVGLKLEF
ncbi:MAG: MBL fold metallo-hydrolase [Candidatus Melainabacteria bacterium RIFOXYA2_FULL_32_9]|nr:MAG: MBL fold metallo-hydrolase [Candidatus Melainabacteria bacterium RIFOXYA2_FULL_32_9]